MKHVSWLSLVAILWSSSAWAGAAVTYHGRILDASERPVEAANVVFKIQVRSPGASNCLLYEETRTVNMSGSEGVFVIPIGDGQGTRSSADPGITIENIFSNNTDLNFASLHCNSGNAYAPQLLDARKLVVSFDDQSGAGEQVLPPMDVNYVPLALHSQEATTALKVGSTPASQVLTVSSGTATPLSAAYFAELINLITGNSNNYVKSSALPSCNSGEVLKSSGGAFVCVTDDVGNDTLAGIACTDGKILKRTAGAWACADETSTATDPLVKPFAKADPGTGLKDVSGTLQADFGTGAGKVVEGNDSRLSDPRAPNGAATGDLAGSYPNPSVKAIHGNAISAVTPQDGQLYQWVSGSTEWQPKYMSFADLRKSDGTPQMPATCAADETLSWSAVTDVFACASIGSLDASKITTGTIAYGRLPVGTGAGTIAAGDDSRFTNSRAPNGPATGDLDGTYPNPSVTKIQGVAIDSAAPTTGQILRYDGTKWAPATDGSLSGVTSLTGDVSSSGAGVATATVNQVGGVTASNVAAGANLANAATDANTASAIVKRDASGGFSAGTITATSFVGAFSGTATNTTQIQGQPVDATAPVAAGQLLRWDGSKYVAKNLLVQDLKNNLGTAQIPLTCTSSETMTYDSLTDKFVCSAITVTSFSGSLAGDVTGSQSATSVAQVGGVTASNVAAGANLANAATDANTASTIVKRDASGGFTAGTVTATSFVGALSGSATSFTGSLAGDVTGTQGATSVAQVGGVTASNVAAGANLANAATNANTASALVKRDSSGNFTAGTVTANLIGNVTGNVTGNVSGTAANVTGIVAPANGGTGLSSLGTLNQILGVNAAGTAMESKSLIQGTGVTIAHSAGGITISATGSGGTLTALTGDVTASGTGSVSSTVAQVGGVTAANVAAGANLANAATNANTASTIVKRDASGNFTAGTITANLTGNVTTLTTKGDMLVTNGTNNARLAVGTDGQVLTADSTQANGVKWSAISVTETDPKVGSNTTNFLSKWNGSALVTSGVSESGGAMSLAGSGTTPGEIRLGPGPTTGSNYVGFRAPASNPATSIAWTLPSADGTNGQVLATNGTGTLYWATPSGGGGGGGIASVTGAYTVAAGDAGKILSATGGAAILLPLASTMGAGFYVTIRKDDTSSVVVYTTGSDVLNGTSTAGGTDYSFTFNASGDSLTLLSNGTTWNTTGTVPSAKAWSVTQRTAYTSAATSTITVPAGVYRIQIRVYGGGATGTSSASCSGPSYGSWGSSSGAAGGGAGAYSYIQLNTKPGQQYQITVTGAGGTGYIKNSAGTTTLATAGGGSGSSGGSASRAANYTVPGYFSGGTQNGNSGSSNYSCGYSYGGITCGGSTSGGSGPGGAGGNGAYIGMSYSYGGYYCGGTNPATGGGAGFGYLDY